VDVTHIAIVPPKSVGMYPEHIYVNRKNYHSINTQLVRITLLQTINKKKTLLQLLDRYRMRQVFFFINVLLDLRF